MAWVTPKIDWTTDDYINAVDYNRIKNNIIEINNMLTEPVEIADMGNDKTNTELPYADEWNTVIDNLELIGDKMQEPFYETPLFSDNGNYITAYDLNKIERFELLLYNRISNTFTMYLGTGHSGERIANLLL